MCSYHVGELRSPKEDMMGYNFLDILAVNVYVLAPA